MITISEQFLVKGWREVNGDAKVRIVTNGVTKPVTLHLRFCDHSPTGVEWGYGGSGPAQLAFEILYDYLKFYGRGNSLAVRMALDEHQKFKWEFIAPLPMNVEWEITGTQIQNFLEH